MATEPFDGNAHGGSEPESKPKLSPNAEANGDHASIDDVATVLPASADPVYDAKARVLNKAVSLSSAALYDMGPGKAHKTRIDTRYWHGMVSMAALRRCWLWLGL